LPIPERKGDIKNIFIKYPLRELGVYNQLQLCLAERKEKDTRCRLTKERNVLEKIVIRKNNLSLIG
jgi:hypothetical protein